MVTGHETLLLVGLSRNITCTTHLNVTKMEWIVVGLPGLAEKREDGGKSIILPLKPTSTGLDEAKFTCRVTTVKGKTFEKTITTRVQGEYQVS